MQIKGSTQRRLRPVIAGGHEVRKWPIADLCGEAENIAFVVHRMLWHCYDAVIAQASGRLVICGGGVSSN